MGVVLIEGQYTHLCEIRHGWLWPKEDKWAWELSVAEFDGLRQKLMKYIRTNTRIIQAGGCCGFYPKEWEKYFHVVYTFEPDPLNFYCLNVNCGSERIVKFQAALGDSRGFCGIVARATDNVGGHVTRVAPKGSGKGAFPVMRIDDFGFVGIGAMQLDCEGDEAEVVRGALKTIKRWRPVVCLGTSDNDADKQLIELGYEQVDEHSLSADNPPDRIWAYQ